MFESSADRESMVARAIGIRINLGHHVSVVNAAQLLKQLLALKESRFQ
jgi:hypothetical protein